MSMRLSFLARSHLAPLGSRSRDAGRPSLGPSTQLWRGWGEKPSPACREDASSMRLIGASAAEYPHGYIVEVRDGASTETVVVGYDADTASCRRRDPRGGRDGRPTAGAPALPPPLLRRDAGPADRGSPADLFLTAFVAGALIPLAVVIVAWTPRIVWTVLWGDVTAIPWWCWATLVPAYLLACVIETAAERREAALRARVREIGRV